MAQQRHIIKQQILDLHIGANIQAIALQNQIAALFRSQVKPLIEEYCDRLSALNVDPETIVRIDTLEIDLGEINLETLERDFVEKVAAALVAKLPEKQYAETPNRATGDRRSEMPSSPEVENRKGDRLQPQSISPREANLELVQEFLQTGRLPWWCETLSQQDLEKRFLELVDRAPELSEKLLRDSLKSEVIVRRIVYQFSEAMLWEILQCLAPSHVAIARSYLQDIQILQPEVPDWRDIPLQKLKQILWEGLLLQVALNSNANLSPEIVLQVNLLHLTNRLSTDKRSLMQQLLVAVESLRDRGVSLMSEFSQILTQLSSLMEEGGNTFSNSNLPSQNPLPKINIKTEFTKKIDPLIVSLMRFTSSGISPLLSPSVRASTNQLIDQLDALGTLVKFSLGESAPTRKSSIELIRLVTALRETLSTLDTQRLRQTDATFLLLQQTITQVKAIVNELLDYFERPYPTSFYPARDELISSEGDRTSQPRGQERYQKSDIYIQNAGLVLISPFLNRFFETLGLVKLGYFLTPQATQRAILLLQYLVDTSTEVIESLLPLNKLLCGCDLAEPIPASWTISETEQDECEQLLMAIIHHWSVLKNTSPDGLRRAFLQRAGVLRPHLGDWLLQVEPQTYDILINHLPWNIEMVKLPWMNQILYVKWQQ